MSPKEEKSYIVMAIVIRSKSVRQGKIRESQSLKTEGEFWRKIFPYTNNSDSVPRSGYVALNI